jgi:heterodisulfide reductase subunit C
MAIKIGKTNKELLNTVMKMSDVDLNVCYQCKKCTSGCPVADMVKSPPSEIIRRLHLGAGNELLDSDLVWTCASCETCAARCPMGINIAAVIDALRALALKRKAAKQKGNVPLFNSAFLKTVRLFGRTYDLAMIAAHKVGTLSFLKDTDKFPEMVKKGKIALLPSLGGDRKLVKRIFKKVKKNE